MAKEVISIQEIVMRAERVLEKNKETFLAQWILQNQDKNIQDYVLVHLPDWFTGEQRMWMDRKDKYGY